MPLTGSVNRITILRLRRFIGFIGLTLPLVLLAGVILFDVPMQDSISEFFFTEMREVFVSAAAGVGMFLMAYQGYPRQGRELLSDRWVSTIAGISAFTTSMVPTLCESEECYRPLSLLDRWIPATADHLQSAIHFGAAAVFFIALGTTSLRIFTRCARPQPMLHKQRRNLCYRGFGYTIFAMVALIGATKFGFPETAERWDQNWHFTFWAESVALWAFGLSWLMKGKIFARYMPFFFAEPDHQIA